MFSIETGVQMVMNYAVLVFFGVDRKVQRSYLLTPCHYRSCRTLVASYTLCEVS
jgi:hypothetical protein